MKITVQKIKGIDEIEVIINCLEETQAVAKIVATLNSIDAKLHCRSQGECFQINATDIFYIDTVDRKTFLYTEAFMYETDKRLYELEEYLEYTSLFRISKSTIINLNHVKSLRPEIGARLMLTMDNGEKIIVSRQYAPIIKQTLGVK